MESVVFEILPPPAKWTKEKIAAWCQDVCQMLRQEGVLTVGIPEVVPEKRNGKRNVHYTHKMDNLRFAKLLKQNLEDIVPIPYKICVRITKEAFAQWVEKAYKDGIRHIVLVGGERQGSEYPGYSVLEAARFIKNRYPQIKIGGITIFTRRGETMRIIDKMKEGIDFFISQIIFEGTNLKLTLMNLARQCEIEGLQMPKIYLSLALASKIKDVEFMQWLGVEFPTAAITYLTEENVSRIEDRSLEIIEMMLDEAFHFSEKEKIDVGFNIEHVMYSNLHLTEKLFKIIKLRIARE